MLRVASKGAYARSCAKVVSVQACFNICFLVGGAHKGLADRLCFKVLSDRILAPVILILGGSTVFLAMRWYKGSISCSKMFMI